MWEYFINKVPASVMKNVYYAVVHLHICHGIKLYATYINKLLKLNNKILRIILNQSCIISVNELYASFNTLSITELHNRQILILVHNKMYHPNLLPGALADYFTLNSSGHTYLTHTNSYINIH